DFENYGKSDILHEMGYEIFGDGIFVINGKSQVLIDILTKYADSRNPIDLQDLFYKFTIDTFGDISFGIDFGYLTHPEEKSQFVTNFEYALKVIQDRFEQPLWKFIEKYSEKG
ncbi:6857_t:CDS:2, partial [Dentiscutata erythropus]